MRKAVRRDPGSVAPRLELAGFLGKSARLQEARRVLRMALTRFPGEPTVLSNLAEIESSYRRSAAIPAVAGRMGGRLREILQPALQSGRRSVLKPIGGKLLVIDATTRCNQDCLFCFTRHVRSTPQDMSFAQVRGIVTGAKQRGFEIVNFSGGSEGGEATLIPWLPEAVKWVRMRGLRAGLVTNGVVLSSKRYVKRLMSAGISHIAVSVHSHIADDDFKLSGAGRGLEFRLKALQNLRDLRKLNEQKFSWGISIVVNSVNFRYMREMLASLRGFGSDFVFLQGLCISGDIAEKSIIPRFGQLRDSLESAMRYLDAEGIPFSFESFPLCFIHPKYYLHQNRKERTAAIGPFSSVQDGREGRLDHASFVPWAADVSAKCASCLVRKFCCQPQRDYVKLFGDAELRPIQ